MKYTLQGKIVFRPKGETVEVRIENSGHYFCVDHRPERPIKDFEIFLGVDRLEMFVIRLVELGSGFTILITLL